MKKTIFETTGKIGSAPAISNDPLWVKVIRIISQQQVLSFKDHVRSCLHTKMHFCLRSIFVPRLAGVILFSCTACSCLPALRHFEGSQSCCRQLEIILVWKRLESDVAELSRYRWALCSWVSGITASADTTGQARMQCLRANKSRLTLSKLRGSYGKPCGHRCWEKLQTDTSVLWTNLLTYWETCLFALQTFHEKQHTNIMSVCKC